MLNKTPIMTNVKYNINDANLKFTLPDKYIDFNNIKITSENIDIISDLRNKECLNSVDNTNNINEYNKDLTYGMGEKVFENTKKYCNHKLLVQTIKNSKLDIIYDFNNINFNLINSIFIKATHNLDITVMFKMENEESNDINSSNNNRIRNFLNALLKIEVSNKAKVNINIINLLNKSSDDLITIEASVKESSKIIFNVIDLGSLNSLQNIYAKTLDENSTVVINSMYMGNNNEFKDLNYITHLIGEKSKVNIDVIGSLNENSMKNFKGTIDFKEGCRKSVGKEKEHCILLSKTAISKALPILLCHEEDVEGAHSSSSGSIDKDQVYYIMSRGLNKKESIELLVRGKFNSILKVIENEECLSLINKEIDRRLG